MTPILYGMLAALLIILVSWLVAKTFAVWIPNYRSKKIAKMIDDTPKRKTFMQLYWNLPRYMSIYWLLFAILASFFSEGVDQGVYLMGGLIMSELMSQNAEKRYDKDKEDDAKRYEAEVHDYFNRKYKRNS